jgi:hypothetical protein
MTETPSSTPAGCAPGGSPGGDTSGNTGGSFVRTRAAQMAASMQPAPGEQPAPDAGQQQQQQHAPPAEQKIKVGEAEYTAADLLAALGERAEAQSRKATLPSSADGYEIKLPDGFQAPEGVRFEFNKADGALKAARELAYKHGIPQDVFSQMLGVYASTKMGEAIQQAQMRDVNMRQLGVAGPQRVEAVATWLQARAGAEGKATANFLRQFPSAPIVKTMENLMRAFSNQGGMDFSQSHRDQAEDQGKIAGYENMSFVQKRAAQMAQMLNRPGRGGGPRRGE